jgi:hypothetical protein
MNYFKKSPAYRDIFSLYIRGDLRAQGLLHQSRFRLVLMTVFFTLYFLFTYSFAQKHLHRLVYSYATPKTSLAVLSIVSLFLILYNALAVGTLTNTSSRKEIIGLLSKPIPVHTIIAIRFLLGLLRSILLLLVITSPIILAVIVSYGITSIEFFKLLIIFIVLPLFPSLIGVFLNLREKETNMQAWFGVFSGFLPLLFYVGTAYPTPSKLFAPFIAILSIPGYGILGKLPSKELLLFISTWIALSCITIYIILYKQNYMQETDDQQSYMELVSRHIIRHSRYQLLSLMGIVASKLRLSILLIQVVLFFIMNYVGLLLTATLFNPIVKLSFIWIFSCIIVRVATNPILDVLIGTKKFNLLFSKYPISLKKRLFSIFLLNILIFYLFLIIGTCTFYGIFHDKDVLRYATAMVISIFGTQTISLLHKVLTTGLVKIVLLNISFLLYLFVNFVLIIVVYFLIKHHLDFYIFLYELTFNLLLTIGLWLITFPKKTFKTPGG